MRLSILVVAAVVVMSPAGQVDAQSGGAQGRAGAVAQGTDHHGAAAELAHTIMGLERKRVDAMVKKDLAMLDALLADDMTYTHSGGTTDTKASFIALIRDRGRYLGVDYSKTETIPWAGSSVLVRGIATIRLENTAPYDVIFADVWALRDGAWKMVAWQATRVK
jgi:ketosteroid isomerase-like protein